MSMYTDPDHIRVEDPGKIEGNVVFMYLDIFDKDKAEVERLKEHYQRGGLGDTVVKNRLLDVLEAFIKPIRTRRKEFAQDPAFVMDILKQGTAATEVVAQKTLTDVKKAFHFNYF